nr:hypothetical protein [Acaryochloris marina]
MAGLKQTPRNLRIESMNDGEMGSLLFENLDGVNRRLGETVAECYFEDSERYFGFSHLELRPAGKAL